METTEQKIINKQKELIEHFSRMLHEAGYYIGVKGEYLESDLQSLELQLLEERKQGEININTPFFGNTGAKIPMEEPEQSSSEELTEENLHKATNFINRYYRHISGRKESVGFYVKYIQPMYEFINQHKTAISKEQNKT